MANRKTGKIWLAKNIKMDKNYKSVLGYTEAQMLQLISDNSNLVYYANDYSFIRPKNTIKVNCKYEDAVECNYMAFQNTDYSLKYFFAFIDEVKYLSEGACEIVYTVDIWSTWWEYWSYKACFVVREHVVDDTIGLHTIPENVELGEYIVNSKVQGRSFTSFNYIVGATIDLDQPSNFSGDYPNINGSVVGGVYSGLKYYSFSSNVALSTILQRVANRGQSDGIVSIFMGASNFYDSTPCTNIAASVIQDDPNNPLAKIATWTVIVLGGDSILPPDKPTTIDSYTPINKKLLTFPYCYLMASNNNGSNAIYKYELFSSTNCDFRFIGTLTPGMSIRLQPLNYNNQDVNNEEGLNIGKLPICAWNTDVYTNWLTQNSVNIGLSIGSSLFTMVGGLAMIGTGAGALMGTGAAVSGALGIANSIGQIYQHSLTPPQVEGNINNGDVNWSSGNSGVSLYLMSIKQEYAEIIDKYFTRMGYKVNKVKVPNVSHRENYNYVQIAEEENVAYPNNHNNLGIPAKALDEINNLFRSGITIWNNHTNFGDYSVSNNITQ